MQLCLGLMTCLVAGAASSCSLRQDNRLQTKRFEILHEHHTCKRPMHAQDCMKVLGSRRTTKKPASGKGEKLTRHACCLTLSRLSRAVSLKHRTNMGGREFEYWHCSAVPTLGFITHSPAVRTPPTVHVCFI